MQGLLDTVVLGMVFGTGMLIIFVFHYLLYGIVIAAWQYVAGHQVPAPSLLSPSSVPAMMSAETVFQYVRGIRNEDKQEEFLKILEQLKRLITEVSKRPEVYPADKRTFILGQLRQYISKSRVDTCFETAKFKTLAIQFVDEELGRLGI